MIEHKLYLKTHGEKDDYISSIRYPIFRHSYSYNILVFLGMVSWVPERVPDAVCRIDGSLSGSVSVPPLALGETYYCGMSS